MTEGPFMYFLGTIGMIHGFFRLSGLNLIFRETTGTIYELNSYLYFQMVEKLSAVAPDLQTKLKVLTAVAKEQNINWDPTLFEDTESKVSDDLLVS